MPIVNYLREHERFIEYAANKGLTANEQCLWYALFHIMNGQADGNVWPEEFIEIPNKRLFMYCPMGFDAMARARNKLKQIGLIDFRNGNRNKDCPTYRMNHFCPSDYPLKTDNAGFYPQNTDKTADKMQDKTGNNIRDKTGDNMGYPYINQNKGYTVPYPGEIEEENEEEKQQSARARAEAAAAWKENFGIPATPAILNRIAHNQAHFWHFDDGVIAFGIEVAAMSGSGNTTKYLFKTLADWKSNNVFTREDAEEYSFLFRAANGQEDFLHAEEAFDRIRDFRQDRESEEERATREAYEEAAEERRRAAWEMTENRRKERETPRAIGAEA